MIFCFKMLYSSFLGLDKVKAILWFHEFWKVVKMIRFNSRFWKVKNALFICFGFFSPVIFLTSFSCPKDFFYACPCFGKPVIFLRIDRHVTAISSVFYFSIRSSTQSILPCLPPFLNSYFFLPWIVFRFIRSVVYSLKKKSFGVRPCCDMTFPSLFLL